MLALLPRFNARLSDHLFGAGEGAQYPECVAGAGLFHRTLARLDGLVADFRSLSRLMRDEPWPAGRFWHRRACRFVAEQDWKAAFEQALLAQEFEVAVSLLQHFSFEQLFEEQTVVLLLRLHEQQARN